MPIETFSSDNFEVLADTEGLGVVQFDKEGKPLWVDKKARIFTAGTHRGKPYTTDDLDAYCKNFKEPPHDLKGWKVPLQADHQPRSCNNTIGHPRKVWREGEEMFSILRYVGEDAIDRVQKGLYGPLSVGLDTGNKRLEHVAHTPFPELDNTEVFEKKGSDAMDPRTKEPAAPEVAEFEKKLAEFERERAEFNAKLATMEAEKAALEAEKKEAADKLLFAADEKFIEAFCQGPHIKTTPAMKEAELKLYHSLDEEQRALFAAIKKAQPAVVDITTYGTQKASKPGEESPEEIEAQAKRMAGKR